MKRTKESRFVIKIFSIELKIASNPSFIQLIYGENFNCVSGLKNSISEGFELVL